MLASLTLYQQHILFISSSYFTYDSYVYYAFHQSMLNCEELHRGQVYNSDKAATLLAEHLDGIDPKEINQVSICTVLQVKLLTMC